jgi:hypothetical protein
VGYVNEYYVLRFDVAVQYLETVEFLYGVEEVTDNEGGGFFCQGLAISKYIEELSVAAEFHDDIELVSFLKVPVDIDDVGVFEEALYFQLTYKLHKEIVTNYPFFLNYLQAHHQSRVHFTGQIRCTKFTLA